MQTHLTPNQWKQLMRARESALQAEAHWYDSFLTKGSRSRARKAAARREGVARSKRGGKQARNVFREYRHLGV